MKKHEKRIPIKICLYWIWGLIWVGMVFWHSAILAEAKTDTALEMSVFSGVTVSPDHTAWTTDYRDKTDEKLTQGTVWKTGIASTLRTLHEGEHYYRTGVEGSINIGKWVLGWRNAQCIHSFEMLSYRGFSVSGKICGRQYNNGWYAYCADCGERVYDMFIYARLQTVKEITSMPGKGCYMYICPHCNGLEQGVTYQHICKKISYNHYEVVYDKNVSDTAKVSGYMPVTRHMYENAAVYEGQVASKWGFDDTRLRSNTYVREGYVFAGWNTKADGSGQFFQDGQAIKNLTSVNGASVRLYAQWKQSESTLIIDANGGSYAQKEQYVLTQPYRSEYIIRDNLLTAPKGHKISFKSNGGSLVKDIVTKKVLTHWQVQGELKGSFQDHVYTFTASKGQTDIIQAQYADIDFILPDSKKQNQSLVGWYKDKAFTEASFVGKAGETVCLAEDTVLYAKWEKLSLRAEDDYVSCGGTGAVDLFWEQKDGQSKYYKLYQSVDKKNWKEIHTSGSVGQTYKVQEVYGTQRQGERFFISNTGYYQLTAQGAKGADYYAKYIGGYGGKVSAEYWLESGDILTFYAGSQANGTSGGKNAHLASGGASLSASGRGGGAATEIILTRNGKEYTLLIAGGGGGANDSFAGGRGGELLTAVSDLKGKSGAFGGGGGGAKGGSSDGILHTTTQADTSDYAFKSNLSVNLAPKTVQIYGMRQEETQTPIKKIYGNGQDSWRKITNLGRLSGAFQSSYSLWNSKNSSFFDMEKNNNAYVGANPYIQVQARDGIEMVLSNTYDTNGNTTLLVGGGLYRLDYGAAGNTKLTLQVKNAESGAMLYNALIYHGYSNLDAAGIAVLEEVNISGADKITVSLLSSTEGCEEKTQGHSTYLYFSDIILYGKTVCNPSKSEGGTNYINTGFGCRNQTSSAGVGKGDGTAQMKSVSVGYREDTQLPDICAKDLNAPNPIKEYSISRAEEKVLKVTLNKPKDNGTAYYHLAESYRLQNGGAERISVSNITKNVLTTGVLGYYYYVDEKATGTAGKGHTWTQKDSLAVTVNNKVLYLHIAAADAAGNISQTTHIRLENKKDIPTDISYLTTHKLFTKPLSIEASDFVYQSQKGVYYVKADGETLHTVFAEASIDGTAAFDYQIDRISLKMSQGQNKEWFTVSVPHGDVAHTSTSFKNDKLVMSASQHVSMLSPQTAYAQRKDHCIGLFVGQDFTVKKDTQPFQIYPKAEADWQNSVYYSEEALDLENGVTIIPDGIPPYIKGIEALQDLDILDMAEQEICIDLYAGDLESGLREFFVWVKNNDNHLEKQFFADKNGKISIVIHKNDALFAGEISVSSVAIDKVGNVFTVGKDGLSFALDAKLYRQRNPEQTVFKTGDGAVLEIETLGYVERIEVYFPQEFLEAFPQLNKVYEYEYPYLQKKEVLEFNIPLNAEEKSYEVLIKAYKQGQELTCKKALAVVKGNILDELRTRIRNNG